LNQARRISHLSSKGTSKLVSKASSFRERIIRDIFTSNSTAEGILNFLLRDLGAESVSLFLKCDKGNNFQLVQSVGNRPNYHCGKIVEIGDGITGYVAQTRSPLLIRDVSDEDSLRPRMKGTDITNSFMSCPVLDGKSVVAVIHVTGKKKGDRLSATDLKKFQKISEQCKPYIKELLNTQRLSSVAPESSSEEIQPSQGDTKEWAGDSLSILRSLSKYVLVFDQELKITYSSKEHDLAEFLGWSQQSGIRGRSLLDLPLEIEKSALTEKLQDLLLQGTPFSLNEIEIKDIDGLRIVNMFFSPFLTVDGALTGGLLIIDDETENYRMRQRLVEAEKFSFIGSLTSMIAHEVNNPLDGVMRLINLSTEQMNDDDRVKEYLGEAQKGLQRIASLVGSLLTFSRKSASLTSEFAPLNTVIHEAAMVIRNRNEGKDILLEFDLSKNNPIVVTNDFYQIVTNLISNGFDAIASRRGRVCVRTELVSGMLRVTVEDNGCGIPEPALNKIFQPFFTSKKYDKGTGLGLAIVKTIVSRYGGTVAVESEENKGTRMHLSFPVDKLRVSKSNVTCLAESRKKKPMCS
jgi:signal transduction histidine kinase